MAMQYESGLSVPRDYGRALTLYCEAARRGDPKAFYGLGWMYLNGRGVARDDAMAVMWLRKAADRGIAQAANLLRLLSRVSPAPARDCPRPAEAAAASRSGRRHLRAPSAAAGHSQRDRGNRAAYRDQRAPAALGGFGRVRLQPARRFAENGRRADAADARRPRSGSGSTTASTRARTSARARNICACCSISIKAI